MRERVAIVGGGVAGLSAAHELIERGFEVHVYERRSFFGGKAASYRVPKPAKPGEPGEPAPKANADDPPGEHGFRFFPGWYRHLTDTMSRIPYHRAGGGRRSVADNVERLGLPGALTGPVRRGDRRGVARHLEVIADCTPDLVPLYRALVVAQIPLARQIGDAESSVFDDIEKLVTAERPSG